MGIEISRKGRKRLRDVWAAMMERCYDPSFKEYAHYGGSGVTVCDEWRYMCMARPIHPTRETKTEAVLANPLG